MALSLLSLKIAILFCFLIPTFMFGMIPVIFVKFIKKTTDQIQNQDTANSHVTRGEHQRNQLSKYKRAMSFLSCFAAGVFLATCFLELLPSVRRNIIPVLFKDSVFTGFPLAEFLMVIGLFIILVIEQIVLTIKERPSDYSQIPSEVQPILNANTTRSNSLSPEEEERGVELTESYQSQHSLGGICDEPHILQNSPNVEENKILNSFKAKATSQENLFQRQESKYSLEHSQEAHAPRHDHHLHSPANHNLQTHSQLRAMILLCALSLHSIFEGLTVGLQTKRSHVISVFAALILHKSILSFSLGMNLVQSKISVASAIKSIIGFSLASPVGVIIGIILTDIWTSTNSGLVHGVLQGIASGTFLYIIFFEILPKEFNCEIDRILKVLYLIIGYAAVTGIMFLGNDVKESFCKPTANHGK